MKRAWVWLAWLMVASGAQLQTALAQTSHRPWPPPPAASVQRVPVAPRAKVVVPGTDHLRVEVPPGLQRWLDEDDRMRPWVGKAISATDGCYAELRQRNPQAGGTVEFAVTMHKNARPSATVTSLPAPLKTLVVCVTSRLWGVKMPLFTGTEGARYSVKAVFTP